MVTRKLVNSKIRNFLVVGFFGHSYFPAMTVKPSVSAQLRTIREKRGITQHQAAALAGVSRDYVNHIENGETPTLKTMVQIRNGLKLSQAEWRPLLAAYLAEAGASTDGPDSIVDEALRFADGISNGQGKLFEEVAHGMLKMTKRQMEQFAKLAKFLVRYPKFFDVNAAFIDLADENERQSTGDEQAHDAAGVAERLSRGNEIEIRDEAVQVPATPPPRDPMMEKFKAATARKQRVKTS